MSKSPQKVEQTENFTTEQQQVIYSRNKNLLVSASAGTGKTTVMVERIATLLLEESVTIDDILVVTFTNYAAAKMKEKLREKLGKYINNKKIALQLEKIDLSSISTIHSFCLDVLRNYFYVIDLDPSFIVLDENQSAIFRDRAFDETIKLFSQQADADFQRLYYIFNSTRDERELKSQVYKLYEYSKIIADFDEWYTVTRQNYSFDGNSAFVQDCTAEYVLESNGYADTFGEFAVTAAQKFGAGNLASFCRECESCFRMAENCSPDVAKKIFGDKPKYPTFAKGLKKLPDNASYPEEDFISFIEKIELTLKGAKNVRNQYLEETQLLNVEEQKEQSAITLPVMDKLVQMVKTFEQKYSAIKKERGGLDFNDLEQYALLVLNDATALAELKDKYKMIFVDEYQDINGVQEKIISALAGANNLFFVGDIKQSIYGFRESNPDIFAEKYESYAKQENSQVIQLNQNFRSDNGILQVVNAVFSACMTKDFGKVDYEHTATLHSNINNELSISPVEIDSYVDKEVSEEELTEAEFYDITRGKIEQKNSQQSRAVVQKIRQLVGTKMLINGVFRNVEYKDITILTRGMTAQAKDIYEQLTSANIPVDFSPDGGTGAKECLDLINFLRALDNPYNEIYLAGVCLSHFGKLSKQELAEVRLCTTRFKLFDALHEITAKEVKVDNEQTDGKEKPDNSKKEQPEKSTKRKPTAQLINKVRDFLNLFSKYKNLSYTLSADRILQNLVIETKYNLYVLSLPNGQLRCERMYQMLQEGYDKTFAESVAKYVQYVDLFSQGKSTGSGNADGVKMLTIHKSKGLEFPIVIGAALGNNKPADRNKIFLNQRIGMAMSNYDLVNLTYTLSLAENSVKKENAFREKEEELRLLYVLMTRAQNYLYLLIPNSGKIIRQPKDTYRMGQWLWYCQNKGLIDIKPFANRGEAITKDAQMVEQNQVFADLQADLSYRYPYSELIDTPQKIVASKLKELASVEEDDEPEKVLELIKHEADGNATYLGTAYHKVFEKTPLNSNLIQVGQVVENLVAEGLLEVNLASKIEPQLIYNCLRNDEFVALGKGEVYHEIKFMVKAPFNTFVPDSDNSEKVTLQGIIDMLVVSGDTARVIDYKYTSRPDKIVENYTLQLSAYVNAVKIVLKTEKVSGYVLSIKDNKLIKIV